MFETDRRIFLQSFAISAGALAASQTFAAAPDGHAAGYDVSAASDYLKTISRKSGWQRRPDICWPIISASRKRTSPTSAGNAW
jgi:hypothetical protein